MRSFLLACLCASVLAAPQGYQYNQQQSGLAIDRPSFSFNGQASSAAKTQENHSFLQQAVGTGELQQTLFGGQNLLQPAQQFSTAPNFPPVPTQQNFGFTGIQAQQQLPLTNNKCCVQQNAQQQQQQQQYQNSGTVTKDIYVHVAPEDAQDQQYQQLALPPRPPPRKHYRIVFIKAPSQAHSSVAARIQQAPTEEKTIIYVLTKKTDPLDLETALQEVQPKQPSKPEVYFIKYKTKEEAQHAQRTIQAQYDQLGGTSQVLDEGVAPVASVIGSLDGSRSQFGLDFSKGSAGHISSSSSSSASSSSSSSLTSSRNVISGGNSYLPPIVKL